MARKTKQKITRSATETVEGTCIPVRRVATRPTATGELTPLPLERVDNVQRGDSLALGVLGVGDRVADDTLEEGLEDTTGLFVDHGRDTLDTATAGKTTDGRLGDTLDVVTQDLAVTLGATLAESLSTLSACQESVTGSCRWRPRILTARHDEKVVE